MPHRQARCVGLGDQDSGDVSVSLLSFSSSRKSEEWEVTVRGRIHAEVWRFTSRCTCASQGKYKTEFLLSFWWFVHVKNCVSFIVELDVFYSFSRQFYSLINTYFTKYSSIKACDVHSVKCFNMCVCVCVCVSIYIYIQYIYVCTIVFQKHILHCKIALYL